MPALSHDEALARWLGALAPLPARALAPAEALGLVLAGAVAAPHDLPPFDRAMMDGFAIRLVDAGQVRPVAGAVHAGDPPGVLPAAGVLAIMTGAPVPAGAEAVVPVEACTRDGGSVALPATVRPGANIVPRGGEAAAGAPVLEAGTALTPMGMAVAAALGLERLAVHPAPRVAVRCTGAELAAGAALAPGAIRDSNGPMLTALCAGLGLAAGAATVGDDPAAIAAAIRGADADLLVLTGGVSAGDRDFVPAVLRELGYRVLVHGVDQKPGKPVLLAAPTGPGPLVAALPGNPLAVHWCFTAFVAPALRRLAGLDPRPRCEAGVLAAPLPGSKDRPWYVPARAWRADGRLLVQPLVPRSSADLVTPARADAYLAVPAGAAPSPAGGPVTVRWAGPAAWMP